MTPEREKFHELLTEFAATLPDGALVYDIGRTHAHEYREWLPRQRYMSIDRNPKAEPDVVCDLELMPDDRGAWGVYQGDALICNGVTESSDHPFRLIDSCRRLIVGRALFGIRLTGYPVSEKHDLTRFTFSGAKHLLKISGFETFRATPVYREGISDPTYAYFVCKAS